MAGNGATEPAATVAPAAQQGWLDLLKRRGGWLLAGVGVVLLILGWYGASGQAHVAQQIPYVASASLPGVALVISGAVLVGAERLRVAGGADGATAALVAELHELLTEPLPQGDDDAAVATVARRDARDGDRGRGDGSTDADDHTGDTGDAVDTDDTEARWTVPGTLSYHRPGCPLLRGKPDAHPLRPDQLRGAAFTPCPVCQPAAIGRAVPDADTAGDADDDVN
jgi:hypothetical protein